MNPRPLTAAAFPIPHGFFTREGGVSRGAYASLNCSLSGADDPAAVAANRALVAASLGLAPGALVGLTQVHGAEVVIVREPWAAGAGPRADAMVTSRAEIGLGIITADCAPVLFADPAAGVIGAAHAGWRGAVAGVLEATISAMVTLGASRARIGAAVGPCIGARSYEVGAEVHDAVAAVGPEPARFLAPGRPGRWQFDLAFYCAARLSRSGLSEVSVLPADTAADEARFFSHRRRTLAGGGPLGHQISVACLR